MEDKQWKRLIKYFLIGAGILIVVAFLLWKYPLVSGFFTNLFKIIRPLIIGGVLAFILNKPLVIIQRLYLKLPMAKVTKKGKERTFYKLSILTVYVLFLVIIFAVVAFIVPQLVESVTFFINSFDTYYKNFMDFYNKHFANVDFSWLEQFDIGAKINTALAAIVDKIPTIVNSTFNFTTNVIGTVFDTFVGLIFSLYLLGQKKKLKSQIGRLFSVICSEKKYNTIHRFYRLTSDTFSSFITGQLTEAVILGVMAFIGMSIFGFEYAVLISVILGITNLIPIFGPIIGTIPCALILLLVSPTKVIWFVIFVIVLQQIECNLIYPRVVGGSVGLSPVWTLAAVVVGGGLFGVGGMLLGVPAMSIIYMSVGHVVNESLEKRKKDAIKKSGETP